MPLVSFLISVLQLYVFGAASGYGSVNETDYFVKAEMLELNMRHLLAKRRIEVGHPQF